MINVVDALCGAGKSTAIYKMMRDNPKKRYLYITPFRSEIDIRLPNELPELNFHTPISKNGNRKLGDFRKLVNAGENIAATHVLFGMLTPSIVQMIIEWDYCLIIDEVTDCVGLLPSDYKKSDTDAMILGEFVSVDESNRGKLTWNEEKYPAHDGKYKEIRNMCNLDMLYSYKGSFMLWESPPAILKGLSEIYILTYLFKGSDMKCWLEINKIPFDYVPHEVLGLRPEGELKKIFKDNLEILSNRNLENTRQQNGTLSSTWFAKAKKDAIDKYRAMMRSTVVKHKASCGNVFWTTYKDHAKKLSGHGYATGISEKDKDKVEKCFLPCNIRATNDYADYGLCMYAMNVFKNPVEVLYMKENGADVDEDSFSRSELIQFISRGIIRQGKPMKLLILSKRMRCLLESWLNE